MTEQIHMFEEDLLKIEKPIRLIELFAGYGSQALALKYLGVPFESWRISEWAIKSIQAYKDLHIDDDRDYSEGMTVDDVKKTLYDMGISSNYNEPMSEQSVKRLGEKQARMIYNNIRATKNLVNVCKIHPDDLGIVDTDKYCYIMTYSFPCQDLSTAGLKKGMSKGGETRSGLLWEVERILTELMEVNKLPDILLMENVEAILQQVNRSDFIKWITRLEQLGYKSDYKLLNAKDFGVPQNRPRVFMVSNLYGKYYKFPEGEKTKKRIKDIEDGEAGNDYDLCLSTIKMLERLKHNAEKNGNHGLGWHPNTTEELSWCILTAQNRSNGQYLVVPLENKRVVMGKDKDIKIVGEEIFVNGVRAKIRTFTPLECFRLMGVKDEDFYKIKRNQTKSGLFHLAGDSIVVNVLTAIFGKMLNIAERDLT